MNDLAELAVERERFLSSGEAPRGVRADILRSWRRCFSWSVQPERIGPRYQPDINPESPLLRAAIPVLEGMSERLGELGMGYILTDAEALILDRRVCDKSLLGALDARNAAPGFVFAEDAVGTNGLGTTIELGRMARVDGHEHYAQELVAFTCVGVPINDPLTGRRLGVLDVTCAADPHNTAIETVAERTARDIERRLLEQQTVQERELLAEFLAASRRQHAGVVVLSDRMMMTNPQAARLLDGVDQPLIWERLGAMFESNVGIAEDELELSDGHTAQTRSVALRRDGNVIGALMEIRPNPEPRSVTTRAQRDRCPPELVGTDQRFLDAYHRARETPRSQVLVLRGEQGVGKLAVACALLSDADEGSDHVVVDAADVEADGGTRWLRRLRTALLGSPSTLVLRHLELLPESLLRIVSRIVQSACDRGWRCICTLTGESSSEQDALPGLDVAQVVVPPLRNRLGDIPALVAAFASPRRVASDAVQLLMRLSWPGNVRELRSVVGRICATAADGIQPGLSHVPLEVRQAAPRRTLTRFERAEVHAILEALAETSGNKKDAATLLGISRSTLYRKMQAAGIDLDNTVF